MRTLHIDPPSDTPNGAPTDVDAIFLAAGWTPGTKNGWDGHFVNGFVVGGIDPYGTPRVTGIVANPNEGPDTVEEAAVWLVEHAKQFAPAQVDADGVVGYDLPHDDSGASDHGEADSGGSGADAGGASGEPADDSAAESGGGDGAGGSADGVSVHETASIAEAEAAYGGEDETHGETGEAADSGVYAESDGPDYSDADAVGRHIPDARADISGAIWESAENPEPVPAADNFTDADFAPIEDEPPERDALDADLTPLRGIAWDENTVADELGAEILDEGQAPQDRFIGLDDLDRRRSLRIGDVIRYALEHTPILTYEQASRLRDLRSYVAGVAERSVTRGSDDAAMRTELDELEAAHSREALWNCARDAKVFFLNSATREEVEAFDPAADWPE